jgi:hypothetical protein
MDGDRLGDVIYLRFHLLDLGGLKGQQKLSFTIEEVL